MDPYDQKAWDALARERHRLLNRSPRRLIPEAVRERAGTTTARARSRVQQVPGVDEAQRLIDETFRAASDVGGRFAADSLGTARIVAAYRKAGHDVEGISDIQALALRNLDQVRPTFGSAYTGIGVASGAAAGLTISGGEIAALLGSLTGGTIGAFGGGGVGAVPGAGAGAAPGAAVVAGAMAADTAAVLFAAARVVFHTAAYYGYDIDRPEERMRALSILSFATAGGQSTKLGAYNEVQKLTGLIVRNAAWKQLDANVITKIVRRIFGKLGERLTKQKLGQLVPVAGIVIGALFNGRTVSAAADAADLLYRQQFLCDKYDLPFPSAGSTDPPDPAEDDISVSDIVDATVVNEDDDQPPLLPA